MSVIAYRAWNAAPFAGILAPTAASIFHNLDDMPRAARAWETSTATAICHRGRHVVPVPAPGCTCGLYAWKRPIDPGWIDQWGRGSAGNTVVGVVRLWGRMCDGPGMTGYRAQHAQIVALVPNANRNVDLAARYPDVQIYPDLLTMYSEWDTSPELGFAMNADHAATHAENARRPTRLDHCLSCGEKISAKQKTVDYDGRNPWAAGEEWPVRFHRRAACIGRPPKAKNGPAPLAANFALTYDRAWAYANRQPHKLYCPGTRTDHQDDTFTCSEGDQCTAGGWRNGELIQHAKVQECFEEYWPCHVCELRCPGPINHLTDPEAA